MKEGMHMEEQTYEDTLASIKAHYEKELEDRDKLREENDILWNRLGYADTELRSYRYRDKMKIRDMEKMTYFIKVFPDGLKRLTDKNISDSALGVLTRLSSRLEQDTGILIDENGKYMNKAALARVLGKDKSNFNKELLNLLEIGAVQIKKKGKQVCYQLNDLCFYNGINRANSEVGK